jgi:hypothetical protein
MNQKMITVAGAMLLATAAVLSRPAVSENAAQQTRADNGEPRTAEQPYSYTWDELVALIPDISNMHLVTKDRKRVRNSDEIPAQAKLCRMERQPTSRIARRRCFTLDEYVEDYVRQRQAALDFMNGLDGRSMSGEGGGMAQTGRTSRP